MEEEEQEQIENLEEAEASLEEKKQFVLPAKYLSNGDDPKIQSARRVQEALNLSSFRPAPIPFQGIDLTSYNRLVGPVNVYDPLLDKKRAEAQSGWEQAGHFLARLPINTGLSLIETAGSLLELTNPAMMYKNAITEFAQEGKKEVSKALPLYREKPNEVIDASSPGWWLENIDGLVSSIVAFGGAGSAVSLGLRGGARLLGTGLKLGTKASKLLQGAGIAATGLSLGYAEGVMEGGPLYDEVFTMSIGKGKSVEEAHDDASRSAAKAVRLNTLLVGGLNATGVAPFFRGMSSARKIAKGPLAFKEGIETAAEYRARLKSMPEVKISLSEKLLRAGIEPTQEAVEELINEIVVTEGLYKGKVLSGTLEEGEETTWGERLVDTVLSERGFLAASLGAIGGAGQKTLVERTRTIRRPKYDEDRNEIGTERISPAKLQEERFIERETKTRKAMIDRVDQFVNTQEKIRKAAEEGDEAKLETAQEELFVVSTFDNIIRGTEEQMIKLYEEVANLPTDEAEALGYTVREGDPKDYRTRARNKIKEIKDLTKVYDDLQVNYGFTDEETFNGIPEFIFQVYMNMNGVKNDYESKKSQLDELVRVSRENQELRGINIDIQDYNERVNKIQSLTNLIENNDNVLEEIKKEWNKNSPAIRQQLRTKYGITNTRSTIEPVLEAVEKLSENYYNDKIKLLEELEESKKPIIQRLIEENKIKESDLGKPETQKLIQKIFTEAIQESAQEKDLIVKIGEVVEEAKNIYDNHSKVYNTITSSNGRKEILENVRKSQIELSKNRDEAVINRINKLGSVTLLEEFKNTYLTDFDKESDEVKEAYTKRKDKFAVDLLKRERENKEKREEEEKAKEAKKAKETKKVEETEEVQPVVVEKTEEEELEELKRELAEAEEFERRRVESLEKDKAEAEEKFRRGEQGEPIVPDDYNPNVDFDEQDLIRRIEEAESSEDIDFLLSGVEGAEESKAVTKTVDKQKKKIEQEKEDAKLQTLSAQDKVDEAADIDRSSKNTYSTSKELEEAYDTATVDNRGDRRVKSDGRIVVLNDKVVEGSVAIAYLSKEFQEVKIDRGDGTTIILKHDIGDERLETLVKQIESNRYFQKGFPLRLQVDTEYSGSVYDKDGKVIENQTFQNLSDDVDRIPIAVKATFGNNEWVTVGYVHDYNWIAREENGEPINVANVGNNWEKQKNLIREIRLAVLDSFNNNNPYVETNVSSRSLGHLNLLRDPENPGKTILKPTNEALPDPNLLMYVVRGSLFNTGNVNTSSTIANGRNLLEIEGEVGFLLTTPVKGVLLPAPIILNTIGKDRAESIYNTVLRFWGNEESSRDISNITETTEAGGYSFGKNKKGTSSGLSRLLSSYMYSQQFDAETFQSGKENPNRVFFYVSGKSGEVRIGRHREGVIYTTNPKDDNEDFSDPKNRDKILELLSELIFNVNADYLNTSGPYVDITVSQDSVSSHTYKSYSDFIKANSQSNVNGTEFIEHADGTKEYLYMVQPVTLFDHERVLGKSKKEGVPSKAELADQGQPDIEVNFAPLPVYDIKEEISEVEETEATTTEEDELEKKYGGYDGLPDIFGDVESIIAYDEDNESLIEGDGEVVGSKSPDNISEELKKSLTFTVEGFTPEQQYSIVSGLTYGLIKLWNQRSPDSLDSDFDMPAAFQEVMGRMVYGPSKSPKSTEEQRKHLKNILDNDNKFRELTYHRLSYFGIKRIGDDVEGEESDFEKRKFDDTARFSVDPKNTISHKVKVFIASTPEFDGVDEKGKGIQKTNFLGWPVFVNFDSLYDEMTTLFSDIPLLDQDSMLEKIKELGSTHNISYTSIYTRLNKRIEEGDYTILSQFFTALDNHNYQLQLVLWNPVLDGYSIKLLNSDRFTVIDILIGDWIEQQKKSDIVEEIDGNLSINREKIAEIKQRYSNLVDSNSNLKSDEFIRGFISIMGELGIVIPPSSINKLISDSIYILGRDWEGSVRLNRQTGKEGKIKGNFINSVFDAFERTIPEDQKEDLIEEYGLFGLNNPLLGYSKDQQITKLARHVSKYIPRIHSTSVRNIEGKSLYTIQNHTYLTNLFRLISNYDSKNEENPLNRKLDSILKNTFSSNSLYGNVLKTKNTPDKPLITIATSDGLKRLNGNGVRYNSMTSTDEYLTMLGIYQSQVSSNGKVNFIVPTHSDRTSDPHIIGFIPIQTRQIGDKLYRGIFDSDIVVKTEGEEIIDIDGAAEKALKNILESEIQRIHIFQTQYRGKQEGNIAFEQYYNGAENFYIFNYLNKDVIVDTLIRNDIDPNRALEIWNGNDIRNTPESKELIYSIVKAETIREINRQISEWRDLDLIVEGFDEEYNEIIKNIPLFDKSYLSTIQGFGFNRLAYAATDFVVNYMTFYSEYYKLVSGDPAIYFKKDIATTLNNMQKRFAGILSPFHSPNAPVGSTYITATIGDRIVSLEESKQYNEKFGITDYDSVNSTDAQEYTTLQEHINVMRYYGTIPEDVYQSISKKIKEAKEDLNNPTNFFNLDAKELRVVMQVVKPVHFTDKHEDIYNFRNMLFIKSSSFPLIPQLTRDLQLDKLRVAMEGSDPSGDYVNRVSYQSAVKIGAKSIDTIWDKNGNIKSTIDLSSSRQVLPRYNFGIQQDIPIKDMEVLIVSQMDKLLTVTLGDLGKIMHEGEEYTGKSIKKLKQQTVIQLYNRSRDKLLKELGAVLDNGRYTFPDIKKVHDLLVSEATSKGREWPPNDIEALKTIINDTTGEHEFSIPLSFSNSSAKIESLLLSIITNRIVRQRVFGKAWVQGSSAGFVDADGEFRSDEGLTVKDYEHLGVRFFDGYDSSTPLSFITQGEDGKMKPAQVIVPWFFKDRGGSLLKMNDFTKKSEDGRLVIDQSKIDPEVLRMIAARIPNQDAMVPVEIVGFLPPNMGSLAIVPDGLIKMMGSDFDVDKLYTYMTQYSIGYKTTKDKDGKDVRNPVKIRKIRMQVKKGRDEKGKLIYEDAESQDDLSTRQLKQKYMDIHWDVLMHPGVFKRIISTIDLPDLKNEANKVKIDVKVPIYPSTQVEDHQNQMEGNRLIGVYANGLTLNATIEDENLVLLNTKGKEPIYYSFKIRDDNGNIVELTRLSGYGTSTYDGVTRTKTQNLSMHLGASVDNANENIVDKLNNNIDTASHIVLLHTLESDKGVAVPVSYTSALMRQEAIVMYVKELRKSRSSIVETFSKDRRKDAIRVVIDRIKSNITDGNLEPSDSIYGSKELYKLIETSETIEENKVKSGYSRIYRIQVDPKDENNIPQWVLDSEKYKASALASGSWFGESLEEVEWYRKDLSDIPHKIIYVDVPTEIAEKYRVSNIREGDLNEGLDPQKYSARPDKEFFIPKNILDKYEKFEQKFSSEDVNNYWREQLNIINEFAALMGTADELNSLRKLLFFGDRNGGGGSLLEASFMSRDINSIAGRRFSLIGGVNSIFRFDEEGNLINDENTNQYVAASINTTLLANDLFKQFYQYDTNTFKEIIERLSLINGSRNLSIEDSLSAWNGMKSYIFSSGELGFGENTFGIRRKLLFTLKRGEEIVSNSLAVRVRDAKEQPWGLNNFFLQRLHPEIATEGGRPDLVIYNAGKAQRFDDIEPIIGFAGLILSGDPVQQQLAADLVVYNYLIGGVQTPNSFLRYIPLGYLEHAIPFAKVLRSLNLDSTSREEAKIVVNIGEFIDQYIKNNPDKAAVTDTKSVRLINGGEYISLVDPTSFKEEDQREVDRYSNLLRDSKHMPYPQYISMWSKVNNQWMLFEYGGRDSKTGRYIFNRVNTLGSAQNRKLNIAEYNIGKGRGFLSGIDADNNPTQAIRKPKIIPIIPPTPVQPQQENTSLSSNLVDTYTQGKANFDIEGVPELLSNLGDESPLFGELGRLISSIAENKPELFGKDFSIDILTEEEAKARKFYGKGLYRRDNNKVLINKDKQVSQYDFVQTLLHENIHALTVESIDQYLNNDENLDRKIRERISSLEDTWKLLRLNLIQDDTRRDEFLAFEAEYQQRLKDRQEGKEVPSTIGVGLSRPDQVLYYSAVSLKEFVTGVMTEPDVQRHLNSIEYNKEKTLLERIKEQLANIIKAIAEVIGIDVNKNSALYSTIEDIISLLDELGEVRPITEEVGEVSKGVNIWSGSSDNLGAALTNPTTLSKSKNKIGKNYPIEYNGKKYTDAEEAYKAVKTGTPRDFSIMTNIIETKLRQYPELVEAISNRGGVPWLENSEHTVGVKNSRWEGKGRDSAFIRSLIEAYERVKPADITQTSEPSYGRLFISMSPGNEDKISLGFKSTTVRSQREFEKIGLPVGSSGSIKIKGEIYTVTNRGLLSIEEAGGVEAILKSEGVSSIDHFAYKQTKDWARGKGKLYVYDIHRASDITQSNQPVSEIKFKESQSSGYRDRTLKNASADATIAIAVNFNSAGERLTKKSVLNQGKKYIPIDVSEKLEVTPALIQRVVNSLNSVNASSLNIAGNGIYTMRESGYTQDQVDDFTYELIKGVIESPNLKNKITSIRTGGQTGFDEAGAKAGMRLGIPTRILAPKGWKFRDITGKDISNEAAFKARFGEITPEPSIQQIDLFNREPQNINVSKLEHPILGMRDELINYTIGQKEALIKIADYIDKDQTGNPAPFILSGYAGTGKTTIIENIKNYGKRIAKKEIFLLAPTNQAVKVLKSKIQDDSINFRTIHGALYGEPNEITGLWEPNSSLDYRSIVIIDESSMIDSDILRDIYDHAINKGAKVIFIGDGFQLPPVGRDPHLLDKYDHVLTEVKRQTSSFLLDYATALRSLRENITPSETQGNVFIHSVNSLVGKFIDSIKKEEDSIYITVINSERIKVNNLARESKYGKNINSLVIGDKIISISNSTSKKNGETFTVDDILSIKDIGTLDYVTKYGGKTTTVKERAFLAKIRVDNSTLDMVLFPQTKSPSLYHGNFDLPEGFSPVLQDIKGGLSKSVIIGTYGYAITAHKSQGGQWDKVFMNQSFLFKNVNPEEHARWRYTAITRASNELNITNNNAKVISNREIENVSREHGGELDNPSTNYSLDSESIILAPETQRRVEVIDVSINKVRENLSGDIDAERRRVLQRRLTELLRDREELIELQGIETIKRIADRQLDWVERVTKKKNITPSELEFASHIAETWSYDVNKDVISPARLVKGDLYNETFQEIGGRADTLSNSLMIINRDWFINFINERYSDLNISLDNLNELQELGYVKSQFFHLGKVNDLFIQFIGETLSNSARILGKSMDDLKKDLEELTKGVDTKRILQTDEDGNMTFRFIDQYSYKYYDKYEESRSRLDGGLYKSSIATDPKDSDRIRNASLRNYYNSMSEVEEVIDTRKLLDKDERSKYVSYLEKEYGKELADYAIARSEEQYRKFLQERKEYTRQITFDIESGDIEIGEGETREEVREKLLEEYDSVYSPLTYLGERYSKVRSLVNTEGWKNTTSLPRKKTPEGKDSGMYDKKYEQLSEAELNLLNYIVKTIAKIKDFLPPEYANAVTRNFLAVVQKGFLESAMEDGVVATINKGNQDFFKFITSKDPLTLEAANQRKNKKMAKEGKNPNSDRIVAPIRFIKDKVDKKDRSLDVVSVMEQFVGMAYNYRFKTEVQDIMMLAKRIVNEASPKESNRGKLSTLLDKRSDTTRLRESVEYHMLHMIAGKGKVEDEFKSNIRLYSLNPIKNYKKLVEANKIERQRDKLDQDLKDGKIKEEDYIEQIKELSKRYEALGGRSLVWGNVGDAILRYQQAKGLAFNITAGINNVGFGIMANFIHASGNLEYGDSEALKAFWIILKKRSKANSKLAHIIRKFDILFEVTEMRYGKDRSNKSHIKHLNLSNLGIYEVQRRTEFMAQGMSTVATMLKHKVKDKDGNEVSLWDAFDEEGNWNVEKMGENKEWEPPTSSLQRNEFTKFRNKVIELNITLHGNYDPNSGMQVKKHVLGRGLMMFKSWMPEGFASRFADEYYNLQLGRTYKGRYRSLWTVSREFGTIPMLMSAGKGFFNLSDITGGLNISEIDEANIRMTMREMQIFIGLMSLGIMLKAGLEDDDDESTVNLPARILLNSMYRLEQEVQFYLSPSELYAIYKDPIPATKVVRDFNRAIENTYKYIHDDNFKGDDPFVQWSRTVPILNQVPKTLWLSQNLLSDKY